MRRKRSCGEEEACMTVLMVMADSESCHTSHTMRVVSILHTTRGHHNRSPATCDPLYDTRDLITSDKQSHVITL